MNLEREYAHIAACMASAESSFDRCVIVSDPGTGQDRILLKHAVESKRGIRMFVVPHNGVYCWAEVCAAFARTYMVLSFDDALGTAKSVRDGSVDNVVIVVSDSAAKMLASMMDVPVEVVVYMDLEDLKLPNSKRLQSAKTWFCVSSMVAVEHHHHRGHVKDTLTDMILTGGYGLVRGTEFPSTRDMRLSRLPMVYRGSADPAFLVSRAMDAQDTALALRSYPGTFATSAETSSAIGVDECPICYSEPSPAAVCTSCCKRAFCLSCLSKAMWTSGGSCPWCRSSGGLEGTSLVCERPESGGLRSRETAVVETVSSALDEDPQARVLLVTDRFGSLCDDVLKHGPVFLRGGPDGISKAIASFRGGFSRLIIAKTDRPISSAVQLQGITHVVFGEEMTAGEQDRWIASTGAYWHHSIRPRALWGRRLRVHSMLSAAAL
nr:RING finger domain-containing protein [Oceanusvirus sp.]